MNSLILIFLSFIAITYGQCPPSGCPPPVIPPNCGVPDCSLVQNRYRVDALFPHTDPNLYWQCAPLNARQWAAREKKCACGTVFNPNENPPRCTFWYDDTWRPICNWQNPPQLAECKPWCPDCDGNGNQPGRVPDDTPNTPAPTPPPNNCPCPCPPCIWWPCVPCVAVNNCPCNTMRLG